LRAIEYFGPSGIIVGRDLGPHSGKRSLS
jgi:hypothetical protein